MLTHPARVDPRCSRRADGSRGALRGLLTGVGCWVALAGCAAGPPLGGRTVWADGDWRPFSAPVTAREVPGEVAAARQPLALPPSARELALEAARAQVGRAAVDARAGRFPDDCSGLVRSAFDRIGVDLLAVAEPSDNAVTAIYRFAQRYGRVYRGGRPVAGDLVFFRDTYDLNRDGRENDGLTHVAVVDQVDEDGTVVVIHRVQGGVRRYRMNLQHPNRSRAGDGRLLNDWLRHAGRAGRAQHTGELFAAYATVLPVEPRYTARRD